MIDSFLELQKNGVCVIAVAKNRSIQDINKIFKSGFDNFGENYASEVKQKLTFYESNSNIDLHFIGKIQRRDIRLLDEHVSIWHSVDRLSVLKEFAKLGSQSELFLQVNPFKHEDGRQGFSVNGAANEEPSEASNDFDEAYNFAIENSLNVTGLMCIASLNHEPGESFSVVQSLSEKYNLKKISMGMSNDYQNALKYGATHIRIGSAIFNNNKI